MCRGSKHACTCSNYECRAPLEGSKPRVPSSAQSMVGTALDPVQTCRVCAEAGLLVAAVYCSSACAQGHWQNGHATLHRLFALASPPQLHTPPAKMLGRMGERYEKKRLRKERKQMSMGTQFRPK